ncbi:facilitated trehalose transporter Tret1 [Nilaparvata lugens]|uniref:facilitated trehalose transporter Tret1 n=1 Tax=Nilaparvata lugens TaxID=108931 RepID=UPI00193D481D|nr:facilitated trehalose transporter Tret1 [Nilaparvata lugens]
MFVFFKKSVFRQCLAAFGGSLTAMMAGTSYGWITPILIGLLGPKSEVPMTNDQSSWIISFIELGNLFSPIPAGLLVDRWGRKPCLLITGPIYIASWVLVFTTRSVNVLYLVRILQGMGMGIVYTVLPMYLGEIASPEIRGALSTFLDAMCNTGILFEYCIGPFVSYPSLALISAGVPVVFLLIFPFMPESPYFLLMHNRREAAADSLKWLRGKTDAADVEKELVAMKGSVDEEMKCKSRWRDLVATRVERRALLIAQVVTVSKSLSGIGAVVSYASQTFAKTADGDPTLLLSPDLHTIIMGLTIWLVTFVAAVAVDRCGRRPLLLISSTGCSLFMLATAAYYFVDEKTDFDVDNYSILPFSTISAYCIIFSLGLGPLVPTLQAELFPSNTRGLASGLTSVTDTIASLICMKMYEVIADNVGTFLNFWCFGIFCAIGTVAMYFIVPETKGKTFHEIQMDLSRKELPKEKLVMKNIGNTNKQPTNNIQMYS